MLLKRLGLLLISSFFSGVFSGFFMGCTEAPSYTPQYSTKPLLEIKQYRWAIHPLYNHERLHQFFSPIQDEINNSQNYFKIIVESSNNHSHYEDKIKSEEPDFLLPNPYQTLLAQKHNYTVFAKMGDDSEFRGIFIVRKDSPIKTVKDLIGKKVSYPAPTALAATMMPQFFLYQQGLNVTKDIKNIYVGSQESSIINVYLKEAAAAATWPPPWKAFSKSYPNKSRSLKVIWETKPLINNSLMVKKGVPPEVINSVKNALLKLNDSEKGRQILSDLNLSQFESATDKDYEKVNTFISEFTKNIRQPEEFK